MNLLKKKRSKKEQVLQIYKIIHEMEEPYKEVFWMRTFSNLSFKDISLFFGKTESWARVTYYRAKCKIKEVLKMKYPCSIIQDLLPLYVDEICSEESKKIVEDHLSQCSICKEIYDSMCNLKQEDIHDYHEYQRIKSLKQVKKKILYKQILIGLSSIVLLFVLGFGIMTGLKNEIEIVNPDNCVSVSMINGSLTTRLQGSRIYEATIKRVSISSKDYLFFFVKNSQWDALTTNEEIYSELILCPKR